MKQHEVVELAMRAMWPARDETLLIRALTLPDERGTDAWREFGGIHADLAELFRTDRGEWRRLSPLLAHNLRAAGAEVDPRLWTVLRTASMRESLRAEIYSEVLAEVITALKGAGVDFALFRGAALGALVYEEMAFRHSHDIDVLVRPGHVGLAADALEVAGFQAGVTNPPTLAREENEVVSLIHRTSLPVRLHHSIFELNAYRIDMASLLAASKLREIANTRTKVLSMEAMLLQVLVHAGYSPTRRTLQWAPDALRIARHIEDWELFLGLVTTSSAVLPVHSLLTYLTGELEPTVIPPRVMETLAVAARTVIPFERDLALYGARRTGAQGVRVLFSSLPSAVARGRLAFWLLWPTQEYVQWAHVGTHPHGVSDSRPVLLSRRLLRYILGQLSQVRYGL